MGSAPVRRSSLGRMASSARRGAYVRAGTPGVYGVRRGRGARAQGARRLSAPAPAWITPAPVEVSGDVSGDAWRSSGDTHIEADFGASCSEAWAGFATTPDISAALCMRLHYSGSINVPDHDGEGEAQVDEGFLLVTYIDLLTAGENAFTYPDGAEMHPDDVATVTSARIVGQIGTGPLGSPVTNPTSVRQLAMADYDVTGGPDWHTPAMIDAAAVVVPQVAGLDDVFYDFGFDIAWDEVGGGAQKAAMYLPSIDTYALSGGAWDIEETRAVALYGPGGDGAPQYVATVQLPRYRIPATSPGTWLTAPHFYYADVGLYLGADFSDLAGLPTTLPADCDELDFMVLPPGIDPTAADYGNPESYADHYIYNNGGTPTNDFNQFGTVQETGSHMWVTWFGPLHSTDPGDDPVPTPSPQSLAPASLAADGTA